MNGAIVAITPRGRELALALAKQIACPVYLSEKIRQERDEAVAFTTLREILAALFQEKRQLILIMAAGIAVRILAPLLQSKAKDPAVVVLDDGGRFAISLLSGHLGGANALAEQIAECLGSTAVITTATDGAGLKAVDLLAAEFGLTIEPLQRVKDFNAAMLHGQTIAIYTDWPEKVFGEAAGVDFLPLAQLSSPQSLYKYRAVLTHLLNFPGQQGDELLLRPKNLHVGIGCRRGISAARIEAAMETVFQTFNLSTASIAQLASIEQKQDEEGLLTVARNRKVPLRFYSAAEIRTVQDDYERSTFVQEKMGVGSVCVPTAILAAQSNKLLVPKQKLNQITIAVAEAVSPWLAWDQVTKLS